MYTLRVTVESGENLKELEKDCDPYVTITCNGKKQQTTAKKQTKTPQWNETFEWKNVSHDSVLLFEVFEKDRFTKDDLLGKLTVPLNNMTLGAKIRVRNTLTERPKGCNGSLAVEISLLDDRPSPPVTSPVPISDLVISDTFARPNIPPVHLPDADNKGELERFKQQNLQQRATIDELKQLHADALHDYEEMKAQRNAVHDQANMAIALRAENDVLASQNKQLKRDWEQKLGQVEWEKKELQNKLKEVERQLEQSQSHIKDGEKREQFLQQEIARLEADRQREHDRLKLREQDVEKEREEARREREREKEKEKQREKERQVEIQQFQERTRQWDKEREQFEHEKLEWENERERLRALERQLAEERERMRNERIKERKDLERERQERAKRLDELEADLERKKKEMERKLKQQMYEADKKRQDELDALKAEFERQKAGLEKAQRELDAERQARAREDQARKKEVQKGIAEAIARLTQSKLLRSAYTRLLEHSKQKERARKMELLKKELMEIADEVHL
eukprot:TRINITY_DN4256_c0_g1_i1.p1 TRINITY_DN4256_c0_g1~~TRINITY_DN4256_c0_g1_i1.p1  ORF type:complete len:515 (-),score=131.44 TRINITY_DN4256_c0_g1_i1:45-1589(-)